MVHIHYRKKTPGGCIERVARSGSCRDSVRGVVGTMNAARSRPDWLATVQSGHKQAQSRVCTPGFRLMKSEPVGLKKNDILHVPHVQCNGCFKHLEYRLSMSKKPCHTIFFRFRVVDPQSWVIRVTKLSRFLRYPQDTSHLLCFYHVQMNTYNLL